MDIINQSKNIYTCFFTLIVLLLVGCNLDPYTFEDFSNVEKIDARVHLNSMKTIMVEQVIEVKQFGLSIY